MRTKKCDLGHCEGDATLNTYCGAYVCMCCDTHIGLARCFCGWSRDGGDGRKELEDMGETIDPEPESPHNEMCHEYWDRGLNCTHIPPEEQRRIASALRRGDNVDDIIDPGWGQFD